VFESVMQSLGDEAGAVRVSDGGAEYAREVLTVRIVEKHGLVRVAYERLATAHLGHSSVPGLSCRMTRENIVAVANEVAQLLTNPFFYR
jgi:hypothetical protein